MMIAEDFYLEEGRYPMQKMLSVEMVGRKRARDQDMVLLRDAGSE